MTMSQAAPDVKKRPVNSDEGFVVESVQECTIEHKKRRLEDAALDCAAPEDCHGGGNSAVALPSVASAHVAAELQPAAPANESVNNLQPTDTSAAEGDAADHTEGANVAQQVAITPSTPLSPTPRKDTTEAALTPEPLQTMQSEAAAAHSMQQEESAKSSGTKMLFEEAALGTVLDSPPKEPPGPRDTELAALRPHARKAVVAQSTAGTQSKSSDIDDWTSLLEQKRKEVLRLQLEEKQKELQELRVRLLLRGRPPATAAGRVSLSVSPGNGVAQVASTTPTSRPPPPPPSIGGVGKAAGATKNASSVARILEDFTRHNQRIAEGMTSSVAEPKASSRTRLHGSLTLAAKLHAEHLDKNRRKLAALVAAREDAKKQNHHQPQ